MRRSRYFLRYLYSVGLGILLSSFLVVHGVEVYLPNSGPSKDLTEIIPQTTVSTTGSGIFSFIGNINKYLWWSIGLIATIMVIIGGFQLITARGDKSSMKKAKRSFIGAAVGVMVAMLSYALIKIIINLI